MSDILDDRDRRLGGFVARPKLDDYAVRYQEHFVIRRETGIAEVRMHTGGGPAVSTPGPSPSPSPSGRRMSCTSSTPTASKRWSGSPSTSTFP
ncbi:hypothetical protein AB0O28_18010 [Microbispora sp. NPDC088329]|uniref:hypothetical protein n=1 Tax=Microbispora sp. NPDC088329 TaxID=3154869 RepID=UPI00344A3A0B